MREFDIFLPKLKGDGSPVEEGIVDRIKESLTNAFGGYTHLKHRCEGEWKIAGVAFRDEVTIMRVLDDGSAEFDMKSFQKNLEIVLAQETILIVARQVTIL